VARRLGRVQRLLVASPSYLDRATPLRGPQDLSAHACLVYSQDGGPAEWPLTGVPPVQIHGICRVNNSVLLRELLLAGLGVTLTPDFVVADLIAEGRLVELLPQHWPAAQGVFGIVAHQRHVPRKVAAFLDFVASQMSCVNQTPDVLDSAGNARKNAVSVDRVRTRRSSSQTST
jgi:DNA-binding transcriptional LysR family regulator